MTTTEKHTLTKVWTLLSLAGLVPLLGILFLSSDLRGWTPSNWTDPASRVEPVHASDAPFTVGDCLPGTIDAYGLPNSQDYDGTATETIFTCRSQSSAVKITLVYLFVVLSYPAYRRLTGRRH